MKRPGQWAIRDKRWPAVRLQALRRDGWQCRQCGARGRLEVDHIEPVRRSPERAFELENLQALCSGCHSRKTRIEIGHPEAGPEVKKWRDLLDIRAPNGDIGK